MSIHRKSCAALRQLVERNPERLIEVSWGANAAGQPATYPVDVHLEVSDRSGVLRDISDVFVREKMNITDVQTHSSGGKARMSFTVLVSDTKRLAHVLAQLKKMPGVRRAERG